MRDATRRVRCIEVLAAALLVLPGLAAVSLAQSPDAEGDRPPGMRRHGPPPIEAVMDRHAAELGLDDATREQIREIAARAKMVEQPLAEELDQLHEGMRSLLDADSPSLDDVMQWAERVGAAETELKKVRLRTMLEVRALLSPEQRQKLVRIFEERRGRRHHFRGESSPPPPDQENDR